MRLLAKIFGAVSREEMSGIRLDRTRPFWELSGKSDFPSILTALPNLLPVECILYFEGGSPSGEEKVRTFAERLGISCKKGSVA